MVDAFQTVTSANGLTVTTYTDTNGAGTAAAPVWNSTETKATTLYSSGAWASSTVDTVVSNNSTLRSKTTSQYGTDGVSKTINGDTTGDGADDHIETVTLASGVTTDRVESLSYNGAIFGENYTSTQADTAHVGQTVVTARYDLSAGWHDYVYDDTAKNAGGSSTETISHYQGAGVTLKSNTQINISANGLTTTTYSDFTGASGIADGVWDSVKVDALTVNADNSLSETTTLSDGSSHVLETVVKATSADRKTVMTTTTLGTTGLVKFVETVATQAKGSIVDTTVQFDSLGDVLGATQTTTSADGLTVTTQADVQGETPAGYAANKVLPFDRTTTDTTVINADGSRTETVNVTSNNSALLSSLSKTTSANGLTTTTIDYPYGTANGSLSTTVETKSYNTDGSTTDAVTLSNPNTTLASKTVTFRSGNGFSVTTEQDLNGDGVFDLSTTDWTTLNADGSQTEVVSDFTGLPTGAVRDVTTTTSGVIVTGEGQETTITHQSNGSVAYYSIETIQPDASGNTLDKSQIYNHQGGSLLYQTLKTTSADGLSTTYDTAVNGDASWDFWTTDAKTLNADGSVTDTVSTTNASGLVSETISTTTANGLFKTTSYDPNGASAPTYGQVWVYQPPQLGGGYYTTGIVGYHLVYTLVTTDDTVLNSDGSRTDTVTNTSTSGATTSKVTTQTSADGQTITTKQYLNETGTIGTADQTEVSQTQTNGSTVDTITTNSATGTLLSTVTSTTSGNGLVTGKTYVNAAGATTEAQTDTKTYDANGDGGTLDDFEQTETFGSTALKTSKKTTAAGNAMSWSVALALSEIVSGNTVSAFADNASTSVSLASNGQVTTTTDDTLNGASSISDTTKTLTNNSGLFSSTTTTLAGAANPYIYETSTKGLDGSLVSAVYVYDPAALTQVEYDATVTTSWDGRTVTTVSDNSYDGVHFDHIDDALVTNADGSTTETRSGSGSFGAPAFYQTINTSTNSDASQSTTIVDRLGSSGSSPIVQQTVARTLANRGASAFVEDTTGTETSANLSAGVAALLSASALPALLATDILGLTSKSVGTDGTVTTTANTYWGNLSTLRSSSVTKTTPNGLVSTDSIDADGNGVAEEVITTTKAPDGSETVVVNYYNNSGAAPTAPVATSTYVMSNDGQVTTLTTSTGVTDTTTAFGGGSGSYLWSRAVTGTKSGFSTGSASHYIDANGIDTWSWSDGSAGGSSGTVVIDASAEQRDVAFANAIYETVLGRAMNDSETQYLAQYIQNGVFNPLALATALETSTGYLLDYGAAPLGASAYAFDVNEEFLGALGRLPTANELAVFDSASVQSQQITAATIANVSVAIAEYASNLKTLSGNTADPNQGLVAQTAPIAGPEQDYIFEAAGTTVTAVRGRSASISSATLYLRGDGATSLTGNNDIVYASGPGTTLSGTSDTVYLALDAGVLLYGSSDTVSGSGGSSSTSGYNMASDVFNISSSTLTMSSFNNITVTGNNNYIWESGDDDLLKLTGTGNTVEVTPNGGDDDLVTLQTSNATIKMDASTALSLSGGSNAITMSGAYSSLTDTGLNDSLTAQGNVYDYATISSALITLGPQASLAITGVSDSVKLNNQSIVSVSSTTDKIDVVGAGATAYLQTAGSATLEVGASATLVGYNEAVALKGVDTLTSAYSGNVVSVSGLSNCVTVTSSTVNLAANSGTTVIGNSNTVNAASGDIVGITGNSSAIYASGSTLTFNAGDSGNTAVGNSDTINVASGDVVGVTGNNSAIYASGSTVFVNSGSAGNTVVGSNDTINVAPGDTIGLAGSNSTMNAGGSTVFVNTGSTNDVINGGSNTFNVGGNVSMKATGNSNSLTIFNPGDSIQITGTGDRFVFLSGFGSQSITGFNPATSSGDTISLASSEFSSIAALINGATTSGSNTLITGTAGDVLTLVGVNKSSLVAADFSLHS